MEYLNVGAINNLVYWQDRSMFHDLLNIMSVADVGVVICFAMVHSLPTLWEDYNNHIHFHIAQFLFPIMHIAVMTSVYSTILIR